MSRTVNLAYNTVVSLVRAASQKGQIIHNARVQKIVLVFRAKKQFRCQGNELTEGDLGIGMTQASSSGLILAARVGKHTDPIIEELIVNTDVKTDCFQWHTDDWGGYKRVLPPLALHIIGKDQTQHKERTLGIVREQTGGWYRRQNLLCQSLGQN